MPVVTQNDQLLLHISNCTAEALTALMNGSNRYPFPLDDMLHQVVSDRLVLAGEHLRAGDQLVFALQFRSSISRHYYAMFHAARAIVFAETRGDDHQRHHVLPRHIPRGLGNSGQRENELVAARLLRNEADYDPYPASPSDWESDARQLSVTAGDFVQACEDYALAEGHI